MWKICFGDSDSYIDLIFSQKYKAENTLVFMENDIPVASLQMVPFSIRFYDEIFPFYYLMGLCTLPEFRGRGYMAQLILESFSTMSARQIPLAILLPAEDWLYGYYNKFGFVQTFSQTDTTIDISSLFILYKENPLKAYNVFLEKFQQQDFTILRSYDDFKVIMTDYELDNSDRKINLGGMSRIMDFYPLLSAYACKNNKNTFSIKVCDAQIDKSIIYLIEGGEVSVIFSDHYDFEVTEPVLTKLLFGFNLSDIPTKLTHFFQSHSPRMNLMLE